MNAERPEHPESSDERQFEQIHRQELSAMDAQELRNHFEKETGNLFAYNNMVKYAYWLESRLTRPEPDSLLTDDCDINENKLEVFAGGNGDYYIAIRVNDISHCVRVAMSGGNASTKIKLAVANLYRAMNGIEMVLPEPDREEMIIRARKLTDKPELQRNNLMEWMADFHISEMKRMK